MIPVTSSGKFFETKNTPMRIDVYFDNDSNPYKSFTAPDTFCFDSTCLADGTHELRFVAVDDDEIASERRMALTVRNGPAIAVHGLFDNDVVAGRMDVLVNAYGSKFGDQFEPARMETPAPIPTWTWVLILCAFAWGAGYIALELDRRDALPMIADSAEPKLADNARDHTEFEWVELGERVYGNTCASCHQSTGRGLDGVFPTLVHSAAVENPDPTDHIEAIIYGLAGKVIEGIAYSAPMPPFGGVLSDSEIAAVVNHERTQWGNDAKLVTTANVAALRN